MRGYFLKHWLTPLQQRASRKRHDRASIETRGSVVVVLYLIASSFLVAQDASSVSPAGTEAQNCAALMELNLERAPRGTRVYHLSAAYRRARRRLGTAGIRAERLWNT
jgi:hypothetical protein